MITTQAWVLHRGTGDPRKPEPGALREESISFDDPNEDEVLVEPIYGCWEANMSHAIARRPVDVCALRGDDRVVLGNGGVVRVLERGARVRGVSAGDVCVFFGNVACNDPFGYMVRAHGYDAPGTIGLLARRTKVHGQCVLPIPRGSRHTLRQWAAYSLRYATAWSNWKLAYGTYRLQMSEADAPAPWVWGWGGGTTLAELDLARRQGCRTAMLSGNPERLAQIERMGILPIDRRAFAALEYDERRIRNEPEFASAYNAAEEAFLSAVARVTGGEGVAIFLDYIGTPVFRATLRALGRQGVIATAGWKHGTITPVNRAIECLQRHTHVFTHYARHSEGQAAMAYAENTGWMPAVDEVTYGWDDIPRLAREYAGDAIATYFPIYQVNPL